MHFVQGVPDRTAKILIVIIFVFTIGIEAKVLGDDVGTMKTERFCLAALDVVAFRVTFPVAIFPAVKTFACLLGGGISVGRS